MAPSSCAGGALFRNSRGMVRLCLYSKFGMDFAFHAVFAALELAQSRKLSGINLARVSIFVVSMLSSLENKVLQKFWVCWKGLIAYLVL